jgi:hypothetical protein
MLLSILVAAWWLFECTDDLLDAARTFNLLIIAWTILFKRVGAKWLLEDFLAYGFLEN